MLTPIIYDAGFALSRILPDITIQSSNPERIQLTNCWNADINSPFIHGELTHAQFANPTTLPVAIDLIGSMDAHINSPRVTSAGIGVRASTHPDGFPRCEGLHIDRGWLMHVNTGVELNGSHLSGWPTTLTTVNRTHIAFNNHAIRATHISFLHLSEVNCYGSHYQRQQWCIYLVGCKKVTITDCDFWCNWPPGDPGFFGGIVLDQCEDVEITNGTFVDSISLALHATASCKNVRTNGKIWDKLITQGKVANYAQQTK